MSEILPRLAVFAVWPIVAACMLVALLAAFVLLWPAMLLVPVRFEDGKLKVGEDAS